jgi:hypothetical protein
MQILTRLDCISSRAALTHGEVLNMILRLGYLYKGRRIPEDARARSRPLSLPSHFIKVSSNLNLSVIASLMQYSRCMNLASKQ